MISPEIDKITIFHRYHHEYAKVARVYHKKFVSILGYDPTK